MRAIIDLKTGRVGAGWLQVGGYLYLSTLDEATAPARRDSIATHSPRRRTMVGYCKPNA